MTHEAIDPADLPDLASRALAGSVVDANDELFAQRENLVNPAPPVFDPSGFGHKGKVYDGWETRRRREPGHDVAVVRLGVPGVVRQVVVDTSFFTGNYPPFASVEGTSVEGYPSPQELRDAEWDTIVDRSPLEGDTANTFSVTAERRYTHVRLSIYPDGGVARLRVHGEPVADPRLLCGTSDLAATEHGAQVVDCSNRFYSSPSNILKPDRAGHMGEGWENARRRDDGNDFVTVRLAGEGTVDLVEIDTSYFVGNAPGSFTLTGLRSVDDAAPVVLVPRTRAQPDTRHFFRVRDSAEVTHVRLDVYPDGGISRLRVHGRLTDAARLAGLVRWLDLLPEHHAELVLAKDGGLDQRDARRLVSRRPFAISAAVPEPVLRRLLD